MSPCNLCNDLRKRSEDDIRLAFDSAPDELISSAEAKCLAFSGWVDVAEDVTRVYVFGLAAEEDSLSLELYLKDDRPKVVLEICCRGGTENVNWRAIKPKTSISGHPLSPAGLKWLNIRLDVCNKKHQLCQVNANNKLPQRTICFNVTSTGEVDLRLVSNGLQFGQYVALSHCWGPSQICILESKTISQFKISIPWDLIPKTFQDAIIFSAKLGVNHIWIDALCIIQDDPDDWERQSAKMADIYQNSFLTLAATASSSGMGGCFSADKMIAPLEQELTQSMPGQNRIVVRSKLPHWEWPLSKASKELCPLLSRGWVCQERMLSPRTLHFCKHELVWQCREESICECGGLPAMLQAGKQSYLPQKKHIPGRLSRRKALKKSLSELESELESSIFQKESPTRDLFDYQEEASNVSNPEKLNAAESWHRVVEQYSSISLTKNIDRLPALSGLARRFSSPILGDYLAGLWKDTLLSDLMWRINKLEHDIVRPDEYIAPSWSWASVTGGVSFWQESETRLVDRTAHALVETYILRSQLVQRANNSKFIATVDASRLNPYGMVSSGTLFVHGYIQPAILRYVTSRFGGITGNTWSYTSNPPERVPLKYELRIVISGPHQVMLPSIELSFFADYVLQAEGPLRVPEIDQLHLLLVHPYICLVLRSIDGGLNTFRRIGIVRQPVALMVDYAFDWMSGSVERDIQIV